MKCILLVVALALIASAASANPIAEPAVERNVEDRYQVYGQLSHGSFLLHEEDINWINSGPIRLTRQFRFPFNAVDERRTPKIGAVIIVHDRSARDTRATLNWGGPRQRFVGVEFKSAVGVNIRSRVQVWSL